MDTPDETVPVRRAPAKGNVEEIRATATDPESRVAVPGEGGPIGPTIALTVAGARGRLKRGAHLAAARIAHAEAATVTPGEAGPTRIHDHETKDTRVRAEVRGPIDHVRGSAAIHLGPPRRDTGSPAQAARVAAAMSGGARAAVATAPGPISIAQTEASSAGTGLAIPTGAKVRALIMAGRVAMRTASRAVVEARGTVRLALGTGMPAAAVLEHPLGMAAVGVAIVQTAETHAHDAVTIAQQGVAHAQPVVARTAMGTPRRSGHSHPDWNALSDPAKIVVPIAPPTRSCRKRSSSRCWTGRLDAHCAASPRRMPKSWAVTW